MLTIIELPLQILEMTQSSTFMEHWTFREHEIQKGGPQIMTSSYDDVVPGMLPIFGHGGDDACSTCHMPCMCKHPRGSKLSSSNVIRRGEVRWSHNVQFCLKSEVSLEHRGRSRSLVSCARNAADDEDLQLGYVVRSVDMHRVQPEQCCHIVESRHRLGLSLIGAYQNCFVQVSLACQNDLNHPETWRGVWRCFLCTPSDGECPVTVT